MMILKTKLLLSDDKVITVRGSLEDLKQDSTVNAVKVKTMNGDSVWINKQKILDTQEVGPKAG